MTVYRTPSSPAPCAEILDPHTNSSVRYLAESAFARCRRSACSALSSFGGGAVRLSTGSPTAMKNSSCPMACTYREAADHDALNTRHARRRARLREAQRTTGLTAALKRRDFVERRRTKQ